MILPLLLAAAAPQSPVAVDWSRTLFSPTGNTTVARVESVVPAADGTVFVSGIDPDGPRFVGAFVARLEVDGSTRWAVSVNAPGPAVRGRGMVSDGAGGVIVATSGFTTPIPEAFVVRLDGAGTELWRTSITPPVGQALVNCAAPDGAGGILAGGLEFRPGIGLRATIFHVDAAGTLVERIQVLPPNATELYDIDVADNGDIVVACGTPGCNEVFLIDANRNVLWSSMVAPNGGGIFDPFVRDVAFSSDGAVYAGAGAAANAISGNSSSGRVVRLARSNGAEEWVAVALGGASGASVRSLAPTADGGVIAGGYVEVAGANPAHGYVQRFAADGTPGSGRTFGGAGDRVTFEDMRFGPTGLFVGGIGRSDVFGAAGDSPGATALVARFLVGVGEVYCGPAVPNSTGGSATIRAYGVADAAAGAVVLRAEGLPPSTMSLFIVGSEQGLMPILGGGQGQLCLAGLLGRYMSSVTPASPGGVREMEIDLAATPTPSGPVAITAGQTWNFQCWYRDVNPGPTSNATDAVSITFD